MTLRYFSLALRICLTYCLANLFQQIGDICIVRMSCRGWGILDPGGWRFLRLGLQQEIRIDFSLAVKRPQNATGGSHFFRPGHGISGMLGMHGSTVGSHEKQISAVQIFQILPCQGIDLTGLQPESDDNKVISRTVRVFFNGLYDFFTDKIEI
jgi:hypothetical protein